jgi:stearoyl-CoA desaturase (delta-9 desaturase)
MKPPLAKTKMPSLFDKEVTSKNWYKFVNWPQSILLCGTPLIALYGAFTTELQRKTMIWSIIYYFVTGLGITAGKLAIFTSSFYHIYLSYYFRLSPFMGSPCLPCSPSFTLDLLFSWCRCC